MAKRESVRNPTASAETTTEESKAEPLTRLAVPLTVDGAILWDRMRPSTREQLKKLVANDPQFASITGASAPAATEVIPDAWCSALIDMVGQIQMLLAMRIYQCAADDAKVMLYSTAENTALVSPTKRVLNKYASTALLKYGDELALVALLASMSAQKLSALKTATAREPLHMVRNDAPNTESD